jgi:hypothetical protein
MSEWFIEEEGDQDEGFTWNLFRVDAGKAKCMAQIRDQEFADEFLEIVKWRDALMMGGKPVLSTMEQPIDVWTGKPWVRDPNLKSIGLRITKAKKPRD